MNFEEEQEELELEDLSIDPDFKVLQQNSTSYSTACAAKRKWPVGFWIILKLLCVFYHRDLISSRKCFACRVKHLGKNKRYPSVPEKLCYLSEWKCVPRKRELIPSLAISYEIELLEETDDETTLLLENRSPGGECDVCDTQWWDFNGQPSRYTARHIGGQCWNHPGSGIISILLHLSCLGIVILDASYYIPNMWADSSQTLHLVNKVSFFIIASSVPFVSLCSKVRSFFVEEIPYLSCTSALNARYLIKRGQLMNLSERGLPGKLFLGLCLVLPIVCALYRGMLYIFLSQCGVNAHAVLTTLAGIFFYETVGCFMYTLYFVRVSFQHQFSLLLSYIKEHEGYLDKCRGVIFQVATDFKCFKDFCTMYVLVTLPVVALVLTSNVALQYMTHNVCKSPKDMAILYIENNISLHVWVVVVFFIFALTYAMGGFSVGYLWENFHDDVLQLETERFPTFWIKLTRQLSHLCKQTNTLTVTLVLSVLTFFMALQLDNQDVSFLANACNGTDLNVTNHYCK
ncbi:hypothetical protein HOLleu_18066 [Holothuria leucospilota]|uniref:Uncharacterized protein n=1 Tax=Holothuria leucospilota TaxID=206669 RepID=A0A9Q1C2K2_HOLLE|nr:hypothetical protein HOLleu_18066 [Holothuria leucospilota]